jgi:pimeloyl-ACP methyl ester carboxylesterase
MIRIYALSLTVLFAVTGNAQPIVNYGSNQGKYISLFNTKIYYEEYGSGPNLLLLHGGTGSIQDFKKIIPGLAKNFHVIAPDSPGHGRSEQADSLSYPLLASYFSKLIDELHLDSVYVIGYSDGGNAALILAAARPDKVRKTMVSGANSRIEGCTDANHNFTRNFSPAYVEKNMKTWLESYQAMSPQKDNWKKFVTDLRKMWITEVIISESKLQKINHAILIVIGDRDIVKLEHAAYLYRTIPGSQLSVLPGTSHNTFNQQPELILSLATKFFTTP